MLLKVLVRCRLLRGFVRSLNCLIPMVLLVSNPPSGTWLGVMVNVVVAELRPVNAAVMVEEPAAESW